MILEIDIKGIPMGEPRHRSRAAQIKGKWMAMAYPDKRADPWKRACVEAARAAVNATFPLTEACHVQLVFRMPRPKSHRVAGKEDRPLKASAPWWHSSKPDADNLVKAVLDALTAWPKKSKPLVFLDDNLVSMLTVAKRYTQEGEEPGCYVTVSMVEEVAA